MKVEFVENIVALKPDPVGYRKEINVVKLDGRPFYLFGVFDVEHNQKKDGIFLNENEFRLLVHHISSLEDKELELDKFNRDYIQQSHNGSQMEREKELI